MAKGELSVTAKGIVPKTFLGRVCCQLLEPQAWPMFALIFVWCAGSISFALFVNSWIATVLNVLWITCFTLGMRSYRKFQIARFALENDSSPFSISGGFDSDTLSES